MTVSLHTRRLMLASAAFVLVLPDIGAAQQQQPPQPQPQPQRPANPAQVINPNTTVANRPRPQYEPLGIRAGAFLIYPELGVSAGYSDNVGFDEDDEESDVVTLIEPSVEFESQWSRHQVVLELGSEIAIHADESDEDFEDFFALGDGRIDVSRQTNIETNGQIRLTHEGRDDPEDAGNDELTDLYEFGGGAALNHQFNRLGVTAGFDVLRSVYDDDDEEDRNGNIYDLLLRGSYEVSPRIDVFLEGRYNVEDRDDNVDDNGIERDTDGYEGRLGVELDITSVLFGEVFAGYRIQRFDENDFDNEEGVSFGVDLNWNPTLLTSVGFSGQRDFRPTDEGGAASNFRTEFGVTIDHEFLRNLVANGEVRYQNDDFRGDDRDDDTIILGAGFTYWINRNLSLNSTYQYSDRDSNQAGEDFTVNEFLIGFTARL